MQHIRHAVADFGQSLGLQDFSLSTDGHARIKLSNGGAIGFEAADDALLISRIIPAPFVSAQHLLNALRLANVRQNPLPMSISVGVTGTGNDASVVVSSWIERSDPSAADIAQTLNGLMSWVHQWQSSHR